MQRIPELEKLYESVTYAEQLITEQRIISFLICEDNKQLLNEGKIQDYLTKVANYTKNIANKTSETVDKAQLQVYNNIIQPVQQNLQKLSREHPSAYKVLKFVSNPRNVRMALALASILTTVTAMGADQLGNFVDHIGNTNLNDPQALETSLQHIDPNVDLDVLNQHAPTNMPAHDVSTQTSEQELQNDEIETDKIIANSDKLRGIMDNNSSEFVKSDPKYSGSEGYSQMQADNQATHDQQIAHNQQEINQQQANQQTELDSIKSPIEQKIQNDPNYAQKAQEWQKYAKISPEKMTKYNWQSMDKYASTPEEVEDNSSFEKLLGNITKSIGGAQKLAKQPLPK